MAAASRGRFESWLGTRADDDVLRTLFAVMLTATVSVVALDYQALTETMLERHSAEPGIAPGVTPQAEPLPEPDGDKGRRAPPRQPDEQLKKTMAFDLRSEGRLIATGTITPGTAKTFADEVEKRGGYVKTVVLHSPGG